MGQTPQVCVKTVDEKCEHLAPCMSWRAEHRYDLPGTIEGDTGSTDYWETQRHCSHALPNFVPPILPHTLSLSRPPEPPRLDEGGHAGAFEARHLEHAQRSEPYNQGYTAQKKLSVESCVDSSVLHNDSRPDQRSNTYLPAGWGIPEKERLLRDPARPLPPPPPPPPEQDAQTRACPPPPPLPTPYEERVGLGNGCRHQAPSPYGSPDCPVCGRPEPIAFRGLVGDSTRGRYDTVTDDIFDKMKTWTASTASSSKEGSANGFQSRPDAREEAPLYEEPGEPLFGPWPPRLELPAKRSASTPTAFVPPEPMMLAVSYSGQGHTLARLPGPGRSTTSVSPPPRY